MIGLQDEVVAAPPRAQESPTKERGGKGRLPKHLPSGRAARVEGGRMLRFSGVGVINTVTDFAVFSIVVAAGITPVAANAVGFLAANLQSYLLNSRITFSEEGRAACVSLIGYIKFLAAHGMSLAVSTILILLLADRIGALPAKAAALGFALVWNYFTSAVFVFSRTAAPPGKEPGGRS